MYISVQIQDYKQRKRSNPKSTNVLHSFFLVPSCNPQGAWKSSVKTLLTHFNSCAILEALLLFSGGSQHRDLPHYQCEEMKMFNISFSWVGIEPLTFAFIIVRLCPYGTTPIYATLLILNIFFILTHCTPRRRSVSPLSMQYLSPLSWNMITGVS